MVAVEIFPWLGLERFNREGCTDELREHCTRCFRIVEPTVEFCANKLAFRCAEAPAKAVLLGRHERLDFPLSLDNQPYCNRLNTPRRWRTSNFPPHQRRKLIPHEPIEDAACLLGIDQVHVNASRVCNGTFDRRACDFMEDDALCLRLVELEHFCQVPGNRLPFAIFISRQENRSCFGG